jgi:uncharacterized protein (UPF0332 family)
MSTESKIYTKRAINEFNLSTMIMKISENDNIQAEIFNMPPDTYFSAVISHAYYSIFYITKAYLHTKGIKTKVPEEHKKTFEEFKKLVEKGAVDVELLKIYQQLMMRADTLLKIFQTEKNKRGNFTYRTIPQANLEPAKESIANAEKFLRNMSKLVTNKS